MRTRAQKGVQNPGNFVDVLNESPLTYSISDMLMYLHICLFMSFQALPAVIVVADAVVEADVVVEAAEVRAAEREEADSSKTHAHSLARVVESRKRRKNILRPNFHVNSLLCKISG